MIIITYDISDTKLRTKLSDFLLKFGRRIQYSVFEIKNSERILNNILLHLKNKFEPKFTQSDSVYIFRLSGHCETIKFGYAKNEENGLVMID